MNFEISRTYGDVVDCVRAELIRNTYRFFVSKDSELFDQVVRVDEDNLTI